MGHVAKVPGKGDCKSRPLAMFFQVVLSISFSEGLCGRSGLSFRMWRDVSTFGLGKHLLRAYCTFMVAELRG